MQQEDAVARAIEPAAPAADRRDEGGGGERGKGGGGRGKGGGGGPGMIVTDERVGEGGDVRGEAATLVFVSAAFQDGVSVGVTLEQIRSSRSLRICCELPVRKEEVVYGVVSKIVFRGFASLQNFSF